MSKKTPNKSNDKFDLDDGLDDLDFDVNFDEPNVKDDRKPVIKFAKGALMGAKDAVTSAEFIKQGIKDTLPDGFGQTVDFTDKVTGSVKSLYDESLREIRPALKQAKATAAKLVSEDAKFLPKSVKEMLGRWKKESTPAGDAAVNAREALLASTMQETFMAQAQIAQAQQQKADAQSKLQEGIETVRFKSMFEAVNAASGALSRLDQYNTNITLRFQKRSLELQYRQLFAMQDMAKLVREDASARDKWLAAIAKNTSLPEFVKIKESEVRAQVFKNKFYDSLANGLWGGRNQYVEKLIGGIKDKVLTQVKGFASGIREAATQAEMAGDMASMAGDMGADPYEMAGNVAGDFGARYAGRKLGAKAKKKILDSRYGSKISKAGTWLERQVESVPNKLNEFRHKDVGRYDGTMKGSFLGWLQDMMPSMGADLQTARGKNKDMDSPYYMTRRTDRSINEIIPGYLARIFRELQVLRTGNDKIQLTKYDHDSGRITSVTKIEASIRKNVVDRGRQEYMQRGMTDLMGRIDPNNELSPDVRQAIMMRLLSNSAAVREGKAGNFDEASHYRGVKSGTANKAAAHMSKFFSGLDEQKRLEFERGHNSLAERMGDPRQFIQSQIDAGNQEMLHKLGLVDKTSGRINQDRIMQLYLEFPSQMAKVKRATNPNAAAAAFAGIVSSLKQKDTLKEKAANIAEASKGALTTIAQKSNAIYKQVDDHVTDVYLEGDEHPRIRAALLEAGKYKNAVTGAVVTSIDELTAPIIDENGNTIVTKEELPKLIYYNAKAKIPIKVSSLIGSYQTQLNESQKYQSIKTTVMGGLSNIGKTLKNEYQKLRVEEATEPADVYVADEPTPRMTAVKMKLGKYFNAKDNSPVTSPADIKGEVRDEDNQVVIEDDELPRLKRFSAFIGGFAPLNVAKFLGKGLAKLAWRYQTRWAPKWAAWNLKMLWKATKPLRWLGKKVVGGTLKAIGGILGIKMPNQDLYSQRTGTVSIVGKLVAAGEYINTKTNSIITHISQITGEVKNQAGEIVLTEEEVKEGLLTAQGQVVKFKDQAAEKFQGAKQAAAGMFNNLSAKLFKKKGPILSTVEQKDGKPVQSEEQKTAELADKKFKNMNSEAMLAKVKGSFGQIKKKFGLSRQEVEGMESLSLLKQIRDALTPNKKRKGSFEDNHLAEGKKTDKKDEKDKPKGLLDGLKSAFGLDKLADMASTAKDVGQGAKGIWNLGKGLLGRFGGRALAGAAIEGAAGAAGAAGAGTAAAGTAAAGTAATAATGGGLMAGLGSVLGAAASGVAAVLTSPVTLGAIAIGLTAYGGYKLYKKMTRANFGALGKMRMAQYGLKVDDKDHHKDMVDLEKAIYPIVKFSKSGKASLDYDKMELDDCMAPFGLSMRDEDQRNLFLEWFKARFEPVFLTHMTALRAVDPEAKDLLGISDLKSEELKKYFSAARYPDGPYTYARLPYLKTAKVELASPQDVTAAIAAAEKEVTEQSTGAKRGGMASKTLNVVVPAAAAATVAGAGKGATLPKPGEKKAEGTEEKGVMVAGGATVSALTLSDGSKIAALDAVRYKAYGLPTLQPDKVKALRLLEQAVVTDLKFDGNSSANWSGNAVKLFEPLMGSFGQSDVYSEKAHAWFTWFNDRFLPVFLNYITAFKIRTGKVSTDPAAVGLIKPADQFEIAKLIIGTRGIWSVKESPWDQFTLGLNSDITKENLNFLQQQAEKARQQEESSKTPPKPATPPAAQARDAANAPPKGADVKKSATPTPVPDSEQSNVAASGKADNIDPQANNFDSYNVGSLKLAGGPMADGRNASGWMKLQGGVSMDNVHPEFKKLFYGAVEEYGALTGKSVTVTDAFRSYADQVARQKKYGAGAAAPGTSLHEFGLAIDVDSKALNEMDKMGLLRKYGLTRPVGKEPWHLEPIGIQPDIAKAKADKMAAATAIQQGIGKGGGGLATVASARQYSRSRDVSMQILGAQTGATEVASKDSPKPSVAAAAQAEQSGRIGFKARAQAAASPTQKYVTPSTYGNIAQQNANENAASKKQSSPDSESSGKSVLTAGNSATKIPDASGDGIDNMRDTITASAKAVGVDENIMMATVAVESDFKSTAAAGTSSAQGPLQFTKTTWNETIGKYGSKYGYTVDNASPTDTKAAALMGAHYVKDTIKSLGNIGRPVGVVEAYFGHFLGAGGARKFFKGLSGMPDSPAASYMQKEARSNPSIFFDKSGQARSFSQVYSEVANRLQAKAKKYGIPIEINGTPPSGGSGGSTMTAGTSSGSDSGTRTASSGSGPKFTRANIPQRSASPSMGAAYGMSSPKDATQSSGAFSSDQLKPVTDLAGKQLEVQTQMLDTLKSIFGLMQGKSAEPTKEEPKGDVYTPPTPAVKMTRLSA